MFQMWWISRLRKINVVQICNCYSINVSQPICSTDNYSLAFGALLYTIKENCSLRLFTFSADTYLLLNPNTTLPNPHLIYSSLFAWDNMFGDMFPKGSIIEGSTGGA